MIFILLIGGVIIFYIVYRVIMRLVMGKIPPKPENLKHWTTLYFGHRGSGKSQHQAKEVVKMFNYLEYIYAKYPLKRKAIIYSQQRMNAELEAKYLGKFLYYWENARDLRYCPRKDCWRGDKKHRLHGAWLIFDDIAAMFPATASFTMPTWLVKLFSQARHFGIRILANCQDPFSVNINFRRYVDMCYKFRKIISTRDYDETLPPLKFIFGIYQRRKIKAEILWEYGDMSEIEIKLLHQKEGEKAKRADMPNLFRGMWRGSLHYFNKNTTKLYDTTQDVKEYEPAGYMHYVRKCIDPKHDHENPDAPNFCDFEKVVHELV